MLEHKFKVKKDDYFNNNLKNKDYNSNNKEKKKEKGSSSRNLLENIKSNREDEDLLLK